MVRSDEICSDYFSPIVSVPLPDRRTKSHIGNRKLPPIVGPKSDMADYRRLPPIIISPRRKFSHCPIFHPIFHPTLRSSDQSGNGTPAFSRPIYCPLQRTRSSVNKPFPLGIEPRAVAWQSITLPPRHASSAHIFYDKRNNIHKFRCFSQIAAESVYLL